MSSIPPHADSSNAHHTKVAPEVTTTEEFTYTGSESLSGIRFGSVQTWYVRAVEKTPRFTVEAERKFRERLAEAYFRVSVPFGISAEACGALARLIQENPPSVARNLLVRWPSREQGVPTELVQKALGDAVNAHAQMASESDTAKLEALAEEVTRTIFHLRPSDVALDLVGDMLKKEGSPGAVEAVENLTRARKALKRLRNDLIDSHLRIVLRELRRVSRVGVEKRELLQEGNIGLMKAAERFDETRNVPFGAYALSWVRACMRRTVVDSRSRLRMPPSFRREVSELRQAASELRQELEREPTVDELARATEFDAERVRTILLRHALASQVASLHALSEQESSFDERLPDPNGFSALEVIEQRQLLIWLESAIEDLPERDRTILRARFCLDGTERSTLSELGATLGVSGERIRQLEAQILEKLSMRLKEHSPSSIPPPSGGPRSSSPRSTTSPRSGPRSVR